MVTILKVFLNGFLWYCLITIPSLIVPPLYGMSLLICLAVCWIAGLFFIVSALFLKQLPGKHHYKTFSLFVFAALAVLLAFQFVEVFKLWDHIWKSEGFLLFPLAALLSAWIAIYRARHQLAEYFNNQNNRNENKLSATTL